MPAVLGFVVFVRRFDRIVGPSPPETARFVDKVSSFFQVFQTLTRGPRPLTDARPRLW